ncbi:hypothetical protein [Denitromonas sp.]|uniref:phage pre-tape measure protein n=1 Tax=Denitromonas sp. TaxID=2734609 RepID=UPI003A845843
MTINYTPETYTQTLKSGGTITVRGLNFEDMGALAKDQGELINLLFSPEVKALDVLTTAPGLVAQTIALAADEPESVGVVLKLPFPLQLTLFVEIMRMTFSEVDLGNAVRLLMEILMSLKQANNKNPDT